MIEQVASKAWRVVGLRDCARVDLRLDDCQQPVVIDINANPDLSPEADLSRAAGHAGLSYDVLIGRIVRRARTHANVTA